MPLFAILTFLVALSIEGLGTLVSVIGLSALFGANPIIISFAIALDAGKLVVVSLLYKYWHKLNAMMRSYALIAATITMMITSAGAAGYLSGEFQKAMTGSAEVSVKVSALQKEQIKLEERKKQIDRQIENIPDKYSARQRINTINQFKEEQQQVTKRLIEIDKELPDLQAKQIGVEAKAGPILAIAKSFDTTPEQAVKWVILVIILVFDPLAVFLIVAGNFLFEQHRKEKAKIDSSIESVEDNSVPKAETVIQDADATQTITQKPAEIVESNGIDLKLRDVGPIEDLIDVPPASPSVPSLREAFMAVPNEPQNFEESKFGELMPIDDLPIIDMPLADAQEQTREVIKMADLKTHTGQVRSSLEEIDSPPRSSLEDIEIKNDVIDGTRQLSRDVRKLYESPVLIEHNTSN